MAIRNNRVDTLIVPTREEIIRGCEAFRSHEQRDAMYKVATFLISHYWGEHRDMANSLGVLLLTWNQACYRYGNFSFDALEQCLKNNWEKINSFHEMDIRIHELNEEELTKIFNSFLESLKIAEGNSKGRKSPVAVAKALHLLAPAFFPLWDDKIAKGYSCRYAKHPVAAYHQFWGKMKTIALALSEHDNLPKDVTRLKLIDEYNYAKYTKNWI
jgi:hypothetical protein